MAFIILSIALNFVLFMNGMETSCHGICIKPDLFYYLLFAIVACNWIFLNMSESTGRFAPEVSEGILIGFSLFILSEIMLFFSFF